MIEILILFSHLAWATDTLPYSTRSHAYNGMGSTVQGDIRTLGMSGATVGLADTFTASLDNPAGMAMTLNGADANFVNNNVYDAHIQNFNDSLGYFDFGSAMTQYPWAFSIGFISTTLEEQAYALNTIVNDSATLSILTRELRLSAARIFFDNRLALGFGLILGQSSESLAFMQNTQYSASFSSYAISAIGGISFRFGNHLIAGLGYRLPMHYSGSSVSNPTPGLPSFIQPIVIPSRLGLGTGWIPNRFFRADLSLMIIGESPNAALLKDDTSLVGQFITVQPRLGIAYQLIDFKELKSTLFCGLYYETSRIQDTPSRIHGSIGIEVNPWIVKLGWGFDLANGYQNSIESLGIDVIKVMEKLDLIPTLPHPDYGGVLPTPVRNSPEGLPETLTRQGAPKNKGIDPIQVGLDLPKKISEKAQAIGHGVTVFGREVAHAVKDNFSLSQPGPKKTRIKKRRKKKLKPND